MNTKLSFFNLEATDGVSVALANTVELGGASYYDFDVSWNKAASEADGYFKLSWNTPMIGFMYRFTPLGGSAKSIAPDWCGRSFSMLAANAPLECIYDGNGINRMTASVSECAKGVEFGSGVVEETGEVRTIVCIHLRQYTEKTSMSFTLRIDKRPIPLAEAARAAVDAWANDFGMTPAYVPEAARESAYSFWYSYHQNLTHGEIEAECRRAKELGFNVCIIDDGWQTDDVNRGYAYCGEWLPAESKMGDMAAHVKRVHDIGLKYVLWYSVVFMGYKCKYYEHFKDMILFHDKGLSAGILDPRYKEVREYLKNIYIKALREWKLDGFKLDFIDQWCDRKDNAPYNEKMDIAVVSDAVDVFMTDVINSLREINPDILLEFRQSYIGPYMRKYGNMFRVGDCPYDYVKNRCGVFDLRLHLGDSAVHSDMLMWHKDEAPEHAAMQIIGVLFGVLQYSARLDGMSAALMKMSKFWLDFMQSHKELLQLGKLTAYEPEFLYTWAKSTKDDECVCAVYSKEKCIKPDDVKTVYIANGSDCDRVIAELDGRRSVSIYNCFGELVNACDADFCGVSTLCVPTGGLCVITK